VNAYSNRLPFAPKPGVPRPGVETRPASTTAGQQAGAPYLSGTMQRPGSTGLPGQTGRVLLPLRGLDPLPEARAREKGSCAAADIGSRFGTRLRDLRRSHGMTQLTMAVAFGIDRSYISDVERGKKGLSLATLEVIAIGFHLSIAELVNNL
jgi:DNA-binding XRE family transcriptional regulator